MTPWLEDPDVTLYHGDCLDVLRQLPDRSVHMCATSPPFYGLRDYGTGEWDGGDPACDHLQVVGKVGQASTLRSDGRAHTGPYEGEKATQTPFPYKTECGKCGARRVDRQIGLEETPDQWVERLVAVFREVRRILRDDGTLWIEIGDSFVSGSVPVQRMWGDGGQAREGEGDVPPLLSPPGAAELDGEEPRARTCEGGGVSPEAQGADQRSDHGAAALDASGDHGAVGREVPVLRGDGAGVPDDRPRLGRRGAGAEATAAPRPQDDSGRGLSAGQVPDPLLELQLREAPVGHLPTRLAPKNLLGQPWRLAFALQADGWILRSEIIWARPNPMPESVTDRPTKSHSTVFLLSKQPRYFYDADAIREPAKHPPFNGFRGGGAYINQRAGAGNSEKSGESSSVLRDGDEPGMANARSVWQIPTQPTPYAHFATWPEALCRRMILAGTSEKGCCPECGAPWVRQVATTYEKGGTGGPTGGKEDANGRTDRLATERLTRIDTTLGWTPTCPCSTQATEAEPLPPVPCTVLDPFAGSATTMLVARNHGRHSIGIELNHAYLEIAAKRLQQLSLLA